MTGTSPPSNDSTARARSRRDARRARAASVGFWRVSVVSTFFVVLLGANFFVGVAWMINAHRNAAAANAVPIGHLTYKTPDGLLCRTMVFDNKTAATKPETVSRCEDEHARHREVKWKLQRSPNFNWGRQ